MRASFFGRIREAGGAGADLRHAGGNMRQDGADFPAGIFDGAQL